MKKLYIVIFFFGCFNASDALNQNRFTRFFKRIVPSRRTVNYSIGYIGAIGGMVCIGLPLVKPGFSKRKILEGLLLYGVSSRIIYKTYHQDILKNALKSKFSFIQNGLSSLEDEIKKDRLGIRNNIFVTDQMKKKEEFLKSLESGVVFLKGLFGSLNPENIFIFHRFIDDRIMRRIKQKFYPNTSSFSFQNTIFNNNESLENNLKLKSSCDQAGFVNRLIDKHGAGVLSKFKAIELLQIFSSFYPVSDGRSSDIRGIVEELRTEESSQIFSLTDGDYRHLIESIKIVEDQIAACETVCSRCSVFQLAELIDEYYAYSVEPNQAQPYPNQSIVMLCKTITTLFQVSFVLLKKLPTLKVSNQDLYKKLEELTKLLDTMPDLKVL